MKLKVLGSGSSGNCYLLTAEDGHTLIVEAGLPAAKIKQGIGFDISKVEGCFVSHSHMDHSKAVRDLTKYGVEVYAPQDVFESTPGCTPMFCHALKMAKGVMVGRFKVFTLPVEHDVPCVAFVISHPEMGKTLFVTDTMMLEYTIKGLNHIMIEANYSDEALDYAIRNGITPAGMRQRLLLSHMELKTTIGTLKAHDLSGVNEIVLLHLSDRNSDRKAFTEQVERATGKTVLIARKGLEADFNKEPY